MLLRDFGRQGQEVTQFLFVVADVHRSAGEHIRRPDQHREAHLGDEFVHILQRGKFLPFRLIHAQRVHDTGEFVAVFRPVDILRLRTQNGDVVRRKAQRQVVRDLSAHRNHHAVRCFQFDDIHHPFKGEFIEIQAVAHVVVGGNRFGVIVDEHTPPSPLPQGIQAGYGAPVEFYRTADAVGTGSQHNNRTAIFLIINIIDRAIVSKIQVIGLGRELGGKGINLLDDRQDAQLFSAGTDLVHIVVRIAAVLADRTLDLEIGEALLLGRKEEVVRHILYL